MMLFTGQPLEQNGMPQSMQRAPCGGLLVGQVVNEFPIVLQALVLGLVGLGEALEFHESCRLAHYAASTS
jgi:hypothetical protein